MIRIIPVILILTFLITREITPQISVQTADEQQISKIISERGGKFLLLNLWATWCAPCREEFPDLQKLHESYLEKGLEVIGLSVDYPDETESKIKPFLKKAGSTFPVFVQDVNNDEKLINMIDPEWNGAVPLTVIYDANGNKLEIIEGKKSYSEFEKILSKHLPLAE